MALSLHGDDLVLGYSGTTVVHGVSVRMRPGAVTALIGPNGSGKSTVLRSLARLQPVESGRISVGSDDAPGGHLDDAAPLSARDFARKVTLLSQSRPNPSGLAVRDVVAFGRHPHRRRFAALDAADRAAIDSAMNLTGVTGMASRPVDQLSGGELQRVWLATCLAQDTGVLLLDEPTNHLDLRYQVEILDLVRELADEHGTAIGIVLHDLDHAARVADTVVLLHRGCIAATGSADEVLTAEHLSAVYGLPIAVHRDDDTGLLRIVPRGRHHAARPPSRVAHPCARRRRGRLAGRDRLRHDRHRRGRRRCCRGDHLRRRGVRRHRVLRRPGERHRRARPHRRARRPR